jgi:hypothetical protein
MATASTVIQYDFPRISMRDWLQAPLACIGAAIVTYFAIAGLRILAAPQPVNLSVHQEGAQIRIAWDNRALRHGGVLDVIDGGEHTSIYVTAKMNSVTYLAQASDVEVRLGGLPHTSAIEIARCLVREPQSLEILKNEMASTYAGATSLRDEIKRRAVRVQQLQRSADRLLSIAPQPKRQPSFSNVVPTSWWR